MMAGPWEKYQTGGAPQATGPTGITVGTPRPQTPPSGFRWGPGGSLEPIPGGPQDPTATPPTPPSGFRYLPDGSLEPIPGGPADKPAGAAGGEGGTEGERKAAAFLRRALRANQRYEATGMGPRSHVGQIIQDTAPGVLNALPESIGNSQARQVADQGQREFIQSILRQDSGATITDDEMEGALRTYFPLPGEGPDVIEAKRRARLTAIEGLVSGAGRVLDPELRSEVDAWMRSLDQGNAAPPGAPVIGAEALPAPDQITATDQRIAQPTPGDRVELADGGFRTENDPMLAGVNARVNEMLKAGATAKDLAAFYRSVGIPLNEVMPQTLNVLRWRDQNPQYKGDFNVNLDDRQVPMSGTRQFFNEAAQSPVGAAAIAAGNTMSGNHLDNLVEMTGGSGELANIGMDAVRAQNPGSSIVGDIGAGIGLFGAGRAMLGAGAAALGRAAPGVATGTFAPGAIAGDMAMGGYIASGANGTEAFDPTSAGTGALAAGAGGLLGRGAINTAGRAVSPSGGELAPFYREGGRPTLGQRLGGAADRFEQATTSIPALGALPRNARNQALQDFQRGAFNQSLREIGQELPRGVNAGPAAHRFTQRAFRNEFNSARQQMQFAPDQGFAADLGRIQNDVATMSTDNQNAFRRIVQNELGGRLRGRGGVLTGNDYIKAVSRIEDRSRTVRKRQGGEELAEALDQIVEALDDAAGRQSPQSAVQQLQRARAGYARLVIIEDAARRRGGGIGEFTPKQFDAAVQNMAGGIRSRRYLSGDALMQDYAQAGLRLGDEVPNSGTVDRLLATGGVAAAGALNPTILAPVGVSLASHLPGVRQGLGALMAPNRQSLNPMRDALMGRAHLGGLLLAPPSAAAAGE